MLHRRGPKPTIQPETGRPHRGLALEIALYVLLCFVWGSTWLVIKVGYGGLGPFNVAGVRFLAAGALLAAVVPALGVSWPRGGRQWWLVVVVGLAMFAADYGLIYWGEQYLESGLTAILFATLPLLTIGIAHVYLDAEPITGRKLAGTILAFLGVVALFGDRLRLDPSKALPMLAIIGGAFFAAVASVASKRHGAGLHAAALNAPAMLVGGMALVLASLVAGDGFRLPRDLPTWSAIGYLAVAGSVLAFLVYFSLLRTWSVTSLSFISVFTPAVALVLGFVFLDERPTTWAALGAALILAGVALALTKTRPKRA
jgi:drug/metabolite transporter (DMT)-like permease